MDPKYHYVLLTKSFPNCHKEVRVWQIDDIHECHFPQKTDWISFLGIRLALLSWIHVADQVLSGCWKEFLLVNPLLANIIEFTSHILYVQIKQIFLRYLNIPDRYV